MRINPIIPIWLSILITIILIILLFIKEKKKNINMMFIIILLSIINLRFQVPNDEVPSVANNLDVLFVIDTTISMRAEDGTKNQPRIEDVKKDAEYIIDNLYGARFALLTFNNYARLTIPYIKDTQLITETIQNISTTESTYARGSSISIPLNIMKSTLKKSAKNEERLQIVFFISDGEQNTEEKQESFSSLKEYIDGGAVLGYGTTKGGRMIEYDFGDDKIYYFRKKGESGLYEDALSKIDEDNLKTIAKEMSIPYVHMQKTNDIKDIVDDIKKLKKETEDELENGYDDLYFIFVIPLFILILLELRKI